MSSEPWPYYMCAIFAQLLDYPPACELQKCVDRYDGDGRLRGFSCLEQYLAISCAQLTYRESLRDIEACLGSVNGKLCHIGFRRRVARTNLADANEAHGLAYFRRLRSDARWHRYAHDPIRVDLDVGLICAGFHYHRSLSGVVPVDRISSSQGCRQRIPPKGLTSRSQTGDCVWLIAGQKCCETEEGRRQNCF